MKRTFSRILPFVIVILAAIYFFYFDDEAEPVTSTFVSESDLLTVRYLDVGQADSTIFHVNDSDAEKEYVVLYDVGDWQGKEVIDYLQAEKIDHIDMIIISHPHADHIGQLKPILEEFEVDEVWMNGAETDTNLFTSTIETLLANDHIAYNEPEVGEVYDVGPLHIEVLHPNPTELTGDLNDDSLSILATFGEVKFLFTGDAGIKTEREIMATHKQLDADVLQLGHHGSNTSSDQAFIEAVNPSYAIYSAGLNNKYGHPNTEVVDLFNEKDIPLFGTDEHGTITVKTDGIDLEVTVEEVADTGIPTNNKSQTACIDLNKASLSELMTIKHINEERADEIVQLRPFSSVEELNDVNGIGPKRLDDIIAENKACIN